MPSFRTRRAFTAIEITVTLAVMGVLALVGVGTYQVIAEHTANANAEQNIRRVAANEQAIAKDWERYTPYDADLTSKGADLTVVASPAESTGPAVISVAVGDNGSLGMAAATGRGGCLRYYLPAQSALDVDLTEQPDTAAANCTGASALPDGENATTPTGTTVKN